MLSGNWPAYPADSREVGTNVGMTIRSVIAMRMLQALVHSIADDNEAIPHETPEEREKWHANFRRLTCKAAVQWADSLLDALNEKG